MCRSLQRALTRRLYLLIRGIPYGGVKDSPVWHFPEKEYAKEETLRLVGFHLLLILCFYGVVDATNNSYHFSTLKFKMFCISLHVPNFHFFLFWLQCAEEVIKPFVSNPADVYFVGNAPCGHLHYRLSEPNYKVRLHHKSKLNNCAGMQSRLPVCF